MYNVSSFTTFSFIQIYHTHRDICNIRSFLLKSFVQIFKLKNIRKLVLDLEIKIFLTDRKLVSVVP